MTEISGFKNPRFISKKLYLELLCADILSMHEDFFYYFRSKSDSVCMDFSEAFFAIQSLVNVLNLFHDLKKVYCAHKK